MEDIEGMELSILEGLSWRICAPTSIQVTHCILSLLLPHMNLQDSTWSFILDEVRFQTEYAVRHYYFDTERPSIVALADILNTLDQLEERDHQIILRALLFILNDEFDSPEVLLAAKNILQNSMKSNDAIVEELNEEFTVVFDMSPREVEVYPSNLLKCECVLPKM